MLRRTPIAPSRAYHLERLPSWPRISASNVEARQPLEAGVNALADAIKITLGPKGRNAVIEKLTGPPTITIDGVTIGREIQLRGPFVQQLVAPDSELARQMAKDPYDFEFLGLPGKSLNATLKMP